MNQKWIIVYLLVVCAHLSHQTSTPNATTYIAAVVEYPAKYSTNSNETLKINSDAYVVFIKVANLYGVDIIVFPEAGLTTVNFPEREKLEDWTTIVPNASSNYTPCCQDTFKVSEALRKISCAARSNKIYVVINIAEKEPCSDEPCPTDKMFYYNTNVVFDRTGKIIARYRKTNLSKEYQFNVTTIPEVVTFNTDFGVKFGTFTCFDIYFRKPALQLTRDYQVTDFVYPTAWFSEVPFLTAVQLQSGWSFAENVNLLASGYNRPSFGNAGSGIYLGRKGIGKAIMPTITREEILIFEVPKINIETQYNEDLYDPLKDQSKKILLSHQKEHDESRKKWEINTMIVNDKIVLLHDDINTFETFPLEENITKNICHNNFCCDFRIEIAKIDPSIKYHLMVFNGHRSIPSNHVNDNVAVSSCSIIQCSNNSISSCGSVQKSETVFNTIYITAKFDNPKTSLIMPSTLNSNLLPLNNEDWKFTTVDFFTENDRLHVTISLSNPTDNLVTFGIYSRPFTNSANRTSFHIINYLIMLLVTLLLSRN
ncbi:PREDICTED: vanin-like protein 2 [Trachymyrmex cornetzi]|uniref:Vanin-like protein 1 n=1 Tax=Trachymyrmex cornetzi TaxID=471704 RepID=A0A195D840_9HYME|nr:PREDICTED: vanin-like protein 2 [Trachymyrmex cornetzi]KYN09055.1 Vanin-like protein 1 [Trachymyrmex cornetzi]